MTGRPKLRDDLVIVAQQYRGEETYIVKDPETHKYFRFKPLEVLIMQQFTGEHTAAELAVAMRAQGIPVSVPVLERFAARLAKMELIQRSLHEKSTLLMERMRAERSRRVKGTHYEGSILRMRWSAGDPDKLFDRWMPLLRVFFTPAFFAISIAMFAVYLWVFLFRWGDVSQGIFAMYSAEFYTLQNIVLFWGTAMIVIAIHELGHGVTCKYFGGQVHEMGAMLLYFQPAFYCNVNDAWTFPKLSHRLWVTAAGSWIQLVVAGVAAIVWVVVDPASLLSKVAFFAVLVGGATTVLANANPLIPLDGYYALSDYLEIPNLRQRALGYVSWMIKRHVIRLQLPEPATADFRERRALMIYGLLSVFYIVTILAVVAVLVGGWAGRAFGLIGVVGFLALVWLMLRSGIREWARAVITSVREHRRTVAAQRAVRWGGGALVLVLLLGLFLPWPVQVRGPFKVAPAREVSLDAADDGVLTDVLVREGERVQAGAVVARLRSFALEREVVARGLTVDSLAAEASLAHATGDMAAASQAQLAWQEAAVLLAAVRERLQRLTLRAQVTGMVVTPRLHEAIGRLYEAGEHVVRLAATDSLEVRVRLDRAGATVVAPGQPVSVLASVRGYRAFEGSVVTLSRAAGDAEAMEARVRVDADDALRGWMTGEAKITIRRTNLIRALWWGVRKRIRNDLLL